MFGCPSNPGFFLNLCLATFILSGLIDKISAIDLYCFEIPDNIVFQYWIKDRESGDLEACVYFGIEKTLGKVVWNTILHSGKVLYPGKRDGIICAKQVEHIKPQPKGLQ